MLLSTLQTPRLLLFHPPPRPRYSLLRCLSSLPVTHPTVTDQSQSSTPPESQILSIRHSLLTRKTTALQLAQAQLAHLQLIEPQLHSFLHVSSSVLQQAQELDDKISRNEEVGPLAGVFIGVKDNICTCGMPSTAGSRVLEGYLPAYYATVAK